MPRFMGYLFYGVTVAIETASAWVRWRVMFACFSLVLSDPTSHWLALIVGYGPLIWSVLNVAGLPGGGFATRRQLGARILSQRERDALNQALAQLPPATSAPKWVYALDVPVPSAFVVGQTLYLAHNLFASPYLAAIVGHELGHLNSSDGRFVLGLNRLVVPLFRAFSYGLAGEMSSTDPLVARHARKQAGCIRSLLILLLSFMGGGVGIWAMTPLWVRYWRAREYDADRYAAQLGQADVLAEFLELYAQPFDMAIPYFHGMVHPYTELRIDRLLAYQEHGYSASYPH